MQNDEPEPKTCTRPHGHDGPCNGFPSDREKAEWTQQPPASVVASQRYTCVQGAESDFFYVEDSLGIVSSQIYHKIEHCQSQCDRLNAEHEAVRASVCQRQQTDNDPVAIRSAEHSRRDFAEHSRRDKDKANAFVNRVSKAHPETPADPAIVAPLEPARPKPKFAVGDLVNYMPLQAVPRTIREVIHPTDTSYGHTAYWYKLQEECGKFPEYELALAAAPDPRDAEIERLRAGSSLLDTTIATLTVERDALVDALMYQEPWDGEYFLTRVRGLTSRWYGTRDEALAALMAHVIREALDGVTPKKGE